MNYRDLTPVTDEPVTLAEIRNWCKVDDDVTDDDALLMSLVASAREHAEQFTNRFYATRTIAIAYDGFPCGNALALGYPVRSVTGLTYVDSDGVTQTLDPGTYMLDQFSTPNYLLLRNGSDWPSADCVANGVQITVEVGYGPLGDSPADAWPVPESVRTAIRLAAAAWYENREDQIVGAAVNELPTGVRSILWPQRIELGV